MIPKYHCPNLPTPYGPPPRYSEAVWVNFISPSEYFLSTEEPQIVTIEVPVGPKSKHMICPHCHAEIKTTRKSKLGMLALISSEILCALGCFLGCCLIPFCIEKCMDVSHTCPNCDTYIGTYRR